MRLGAHHIAKIHYSFLSPIYLDAFRVEKIGGINLQGHFNGRSQFGKLGFETFSVWSHFEALNGIFWGQNVLKIYAHPLMLFYTLRPFQWCKNASIRARMKKLCLLQVDLPC
jgi:hypothetical protein